MKKLLAILALSLTFFGCTTLERSLIRLTQDNTAYVFEDEYVIWADGWFCEYAPPTNLILASSNGSRWCGDRPALPPGIYVTDSKGRVVGHGGASKRIKVRSLSEHLRGCKAYRSQGMSCSPNFLIDTFTNDPLFSQLWGLSDRGLDIDPLWRGVEASPDIRVAVIDTGVNCEHEDFKGCAGQFDAIFNRPAQQDDHGHGTHVAGTIGAIGGNERGVSGVSKRVSLFATKFMGQDGSGSLASAARAIRWAIDNDVHIINASWGSPYGNEILYKAIKKADDAGILFVVAAGNNARDIDEQPAYPASYKLPNVITVGAHSATGGIASFSNYGRSTVDVIAPGVNILSTYNTGGYKPLSGTSMAAPHVSGLAALLWQKEIGKGTKREQMLKVKASLLARGTKDLKEYSSYGIIKACPQKCNRQLCKKCRAKCKAKPKPRQCRKRCKNNSNCGKGCR